MKFRTLLLASTVFLMTAMMGTVAQAGSWKCLLGLSGKTIYDITISGDRLAHLYSPAFKIIVGVPGGSLKVYPDTPASDEIARVVIGADDPRSTIRLRISSQQITTNVYEAHSLLVNMPIKQEFEGSCTFTP